MPAFNNYQVVRVVLNEVTVQNHATTQMRLGSPPHMARTTCTEWNTVDPLNNGIGSRHLVFYWEIILSFEVKMYYLENLFVSFFQCSLSDVLYMYKSTHFTNYM